MLRVAINGFGRIGRQVFKIAIDKYYNTLEIVAINDLTKPEVLATLLKYDSVYGTYNRRVSANHSSLIVDGKQFQVFAEKDPKNLPWHRLAVDVVIESTGRFTKMEMAKAHLEAGAKKVVISAPSEDAPTYILGVNQYKKGEVVNNGSCTTNCVGPVTAIINAKFTIVNAWMTTIHAVTAEQNIVDAPPPPLHLDLRRARAAFVNIVPTTTGAARAVTKVLPELEGKFDGMAFRVPVIDGSVSDFTFLVNKPTSAEEVNQVFKEAADSSRYKGILAVSNDPLVSQDIVGRPESAIVDLSLTRVIDGNLIKVIAWYDNEFGYSNRLIEQVIAVGQAS